MAKKPPLRYRPGQALTTEEKLLAVTLRAQGLTHKQIGERLGRARETVCLALREATDAQRLLEAKARAKALMEAAAEEFARDWIEAAVKGAERGRHEPARDALAALGVVALPQQATAQNVQILLGAPLYGTPGWQNRSQDATLTLTVPPAAGDEQEPK